MKGLPDSADGKDKLAPVPISQSSRDSVGDDRWLSVEHKLCWMFLGSAEVLHAQAALFASLYFFPKKTQWLKNQLSSVFSSVCHQLTSTLGIFASYYLLGLRIETKTLFSWVWLF